MTLYRFYKTDLHGHIRSLPDPVECSDDEDAIEKAKERAKNCIIEIWDLKRRVAVIEAQESRSPATRNIQPAQSDGPPTGS
jgi:hypothetical protein